MSVMPELRCRLGNNLFQIGAAYAYAKRTGQRLVMPKWEHNKSFGLDVYEDPSWHPKREYVEPRFSYSEIPHMEDVILRGYFQSLKYWDRYEDDVCDTLTPFKGRGIAQHADDRCAVHIRLTDYTKNPFFAKLSKSYYSEAFRRMGDRTFVVYSDDTQEALRRLDEWGLGGHAIRSCTPEDPVEALWEMSMHQNLICANSTFSVIAGILGGGNVIAPKQWFAGPMESTDTSEMMPSTWAHI